jgi:hypothetical protein
MYKPAASKGSPERSTTGRVFVEKPEVLDEIIESIEEHAWRGRITQTQKNQSSKSETISDHAKLLKEQQLQRTHQTEAIMKQNIQKSLERKNEKEERLFPKLMSDLDKATSFLDIIEKDISLHDETQNNKIRRQFEDWNTTVHGAIQVRCVTGIVAHGRCIFNHLHLRVSFHNRKRSPAR